MSTPIEIADGYTGDSVYVDEYGMVNIRVQPDTVKSYGGPSMSAELMLPQVLELIEVLTRAAQRLLEKGYNERI